MKFQPSNFYVGVIDLFAILLPGLISSLVIYHFYRLPIDNFLNFERESTNYGLIVLLFLAYFFGHIVSQLSFYLDKLFNKLKYKIYKQDKREAVKVIRWELYHNNLENDPINTFKWSVFKLQHEHLIAAAEIERYTAGLQIL